MSRSFFDFFPPPEFLSMKPVGISVTSDAVRAVTFKHSGFKVRIGSYFEKMLPVDTIVEAEVKRTNDLLSIIRAAKDTTGARFVKVALSEEKSFLYEADLPVEEGASVRDAIEFSLEENVPIAPADAVFDYVDIPEESVDGKHHVVVSVFPRNVVDSYLSIFNQVGLIPLSLEIESQAAASSAIVTGDTRSYILIVLGREKVIVAVVKRGVVRFASTLVIPAPSQNTDMKVDESVRLLAISEEVQKVYQYWQGTRKEKSSKIESVLIVGDLAGLEGLDAHISERVGITTKRPNVWQNVFSIDEYVPEISLNDSLRFSTSVGMAIE